MRHYVTFIVCAAGMAALEVTATAQKATFYTPAQIPHTLYGPFQALGTRLQKPGAETVTLSGNWTDAGGSVPVTIKLEIGGKVRLDAEGSSGKSFRFDGTTAAGYSSIDTTRILESLVDDSAETLMESAGKGTAIRFIGAAIDLQKNGCNFYDVPAKSRVDPRKPPIFKRYCFDSTTHFLRYVVYREGPGKTAPLVEVEFGGWQVVSGQAVPGTILRRDNGVQTFKLEVPVASVSASSGDQIFK